MALDSSFAHNLNFKTQTNITKFELKKCTWDLNQISEWTKKKIYFTLI